MMRLTEKDLDQIKDIVDDFGVSIFEIHKESSSGIGYTIDVIFDYEIRGRKCKLVVPCSTEENW